MLATEQSLAYVLEHFLFLNLSCKFIQKYKLSMLQLPRLPHLKLFAYTSEVP